MAQTMWANTMTWSGSSDQNVLGVASTAGVSAWRLLIRANNAGIQIGGTELTVPQPGYELTSGQEYEFRLKTVPGTNQDNTVYVRNPGGGSNSVSYLIVAE